MGMFLNSLDQFRLDKQNLVDLNSNEHRSLYTSNKFIKNEVIEIADLVEHVSKVLVVMNKKIDNQHEQFGSLLLNISRRLDQMEGIHPKQNMMGMSDLVQSAYSE